MKQDEHEHAGNPNHPQHQAWLLELGRATLAAASVAGICFDLARILGDVDSAQMYSEPLGTLINRLKPLQRRLNVSGLSDFVEALESAREDRNDLLHALPVHHGLQRRKTADPYYVRNFYDVEDLASVTAALTAAAREGSRLLYQDGGAAVRRWYASRG